jgi:hypothetical protein
VACGRRDSVDSDPRLKTESPDKTNPRGQSLANSICANARRGEKLRTVVERVNWLLVWLRRGIEQVLRGGKRCAGRRHVSHVVGRAPNRLE